MKKMLPVLLAVLVVTGFFVYVSHAQMPQKGSKNTMTLPNGEVIWDLNGEWNALYVHYGAMAWVGEIKNMVKITQQGETFVGTSLIATGFTPAGTEKIRGELDKDGIKNARYSRPDIGWTDAKGEINENCNKVIFDDGKGVKVMLERK
jgi:hypothetical protein